MSFRDLFNDRVSQFILRSDSTLCLDIFVLNMGTKSVIDHENTVFQFHFGLDSASCLETCMGTEESE